MSLKNQDLPLVTSEERLPDILPVVTKTFETPPTDYFNVKDMFKDIDTTILDNLKNYYYRGYEKIYDKLYEETYKSYQEEKKKILQETNDDNAGQRFQAQQEDPTLTRSVGSRKDKRMMYIQSIIKRKPLQIMREKIKSFIVDRIQLSYLTECQTSIETQPFSSSHSDDDKNLFLFFLQYLYFHYQKTRKFRDNRFPNLTMNEFNFLAQLIPNQENQIYFNFDQRKGIYGIIETTAYSRPQKISLTPYLVEGGLTDWTIRLPKGYYAINISRNIWDPPILVLFELIEENSEDNINIQYNFTTYQQKIYKVNLTDDNVDTGIYTYKANIKPRLDFINKLPSNFQIIVMSGQGLYTMTAEWLFDRRTNDRYIESLYLPCLFPEDE